MDFLTSRIRDSRNQTFQINPIFSFQFSLRERETPRRERRCQTTSRWSSSATTKTRRSHCTQQQAITVRATRCTLSPATSCAARASVATPTRPNRRATSFAWCCTCRWVGSTPPSGPLTPLGRLRTPWRLQPKRLRPLRWPTTRLPRRLRPKRLRLPRQKSTSKPRSCSSNGTSSRLHLQSMRPSHTPCTLCSRSCFHPCPLSAGW